jgi:hypothetical protein
MLLSFLVLGLCASWMLPLHFPPWISWHLELIAFGVVLAAAWAGWLRRRRDGGQAIGIPAVAWPLGALGVVAVVQASTGLMMFWGDVIALGFYLVLCLLCLVLGYACQEAAPDRSGAGRHLEALAVCVLLGGVLSIGIALGQCLELWSDASWMHRTAYLRRPGGNLAQPNHLALLLVMGLASAAWLYEARRLGGAAALALIAFLELGLAITESRSGWLAAAALLAWWFAKRRRFGSRAPVSGVVAAVVALVLFAWGWPPFYSMLQHAQDGASLRIAETSGTRFEVWTQLLEALSQHPIRGWGILQTAAAHNTVAHTYAVSEAFSYSHNLLLDLALWMGVPLALALVVPAVAWVWGRLREVKQLTAWYCLAICIPLAIQSMLEYPFAYAYFLAPAFFAVGALESSLGARVMRIKPMIGGLLLAFFTGVAAWSVVEYARIEEDFRVVRFQVLRLGTPPPGYTPPEVVLFTQLGALLDGGRIELKPGMPPKDLELLRTLAVRYPWSATQYRYAVGLALNNGAPEAIRQMQVIRRLHGERAYQQLKARIRELGDSELPGLRDLQLP